MRGISRKPGGGRQKKKEIMTEGQKENEITITKDERRKNDKNEDCF